MSNEREEVSDIMDTFFNGRPGKNNARVEHYRQKLSQVGKLAREALADNTTTARVLKLREIQALVQEALR